MRTDTRRTRRGVIAVSALLLLGSCGFSVESGSPSPSPTPRDLSKSSGGPGEPRIEILSPRTGETVHGGKTGDERAKVTIRTRVRDFDLVDRIGKKATKGEGHLIFYRLDNSRSRVPTAKGRSAMKATVGGFVAAPTVKQTYSFPLMPSKWYPKGYWTFAVQLVNSDNTPLSRPQVALVRVNVQP